MPAGKTQAGEEELCKALYDLCIHGYRRKYPVRGIGFFDWLQMKKDTAIPPRYRRILKKGRL
mgnify:CR=1 FL=1